MSYFKVTYMRNAYKSFLFRIRQKFGKINFDDICPKIRGVEMIRYLQRNTLQFASLYLDRPCKLFFSSMYNHRSGHYSDAADEQSQVHVTQIGKHGVNWQQKVLFKNYFIIKSLYCFDTQDLETHAIYWATV